MSTSTPKQRSREGCWTCKTRRRKCDGKRPICQNCEVRQVQCEGYDVRLQWGTGIASRGRFTGAEKPLTESVPARPVGRKRDRERKRNENVDWEQTSQSSNSNYLMDSTHLINSFDASFPHHGDDIVFDHDTLVTDAYEAQDTDITTTSSNDIDEQYLFDQFLTSGIHVLHSTAIDDSEQMLAPRLPMLCTQSKALYAVCLAFQTSLTKEYKPRFFEYFDIALSTFRAELDACASYLEDGTWAAGLLLCSVGFFYGLPWTIHLQGMYAILKAHGFDDSSGQPNPFRAHLLEVMGVLDLPSFAIGRQTPCIGIWRRHCRGSIFCKYPNRNTVEHVSGLPRSLLDIFSDIGIRSQEHDFWNWPGAKGTFLQCQLWEAYRLAGMLTLRRRSIPLALGPASSPIGSYQSPASITGRELPTTEILVARILSHVHVIVKISEPEESAKDELVMNAINYPTFVAGLETELLKLNEEWRTLIRDCFTLPHLAKNHGNENRFLLELLEDLWKSDDAPNVDELARAQDKELGLL